LREVAIEIRMAATVRLMEALRVSKEGALGSLATDLSTVISNAPLIFLEMAVGKRLEKY
jgi:hypothetical protein